MSGANDCKDKCPMCHGTGLVDTYPLKYTPVGGCICRQPMWISIPAGQSIDLQCPVHGCVTIHSSEAAWSTEAKGNATDYGSY